MESKLQVVPLSVCLSDGQNVNIIVQMSFQGFKLASEKEIRHVNIKKNRTSTRNLLKLKYEEYHNLTLNSSRTYPSVNCSSFLNPIETLKLIHEIHSRQK